MRSCCVFLTLLLLMRQRALFNRIKPVEVVSAELWSRRAPKVIVTRNGSHYQSRCAKTGVTGADLFLCLFSSRSFSATALCFSLSRKPHCASAAQAALDLL